MKNKKYKNARYVPEWGDKNSTDVKTIHSFDERLYQELQGTYSRNYGFGDPVEQLDSKVRNLEEELENTRKVLIALCSILSDDQKEKLAKELKFIES